MKLVLTPPVATRPGIGVSVIQLGQMEFPESLIITLADWSPIDFLTHWRKEFGELLARRRDRCCIITGLAFFDGKAIPSDWWKLCTADDQVRARYQVLSSDGRYTWGDAAEWWQNVTFQGDTLGVSDQKVSEWTVGSAAIVDWCLQCDVLLNAIQSSLSFDD